MNRVVFKSQESKKEKELDDDLARMDEWGLTSLARLEKYILDYYLAQGYVVGVDNWGFHIQINTEWKSKHIAVYFYHKCSPKEVTSDEDFETLEEAFSKVYKQFEIKVES